MHLICLLGLHDWDGCTCKRCGKTREHDWDGCKCKRCEKARDEQHVWDGCKCKRCGNTRDEQHDWDGCKCKNCEKTRDEQHSWDGYNCKRCGKPRYDNKSWDATKMRGALLLFCEEGLVQIAGDRLTHSSLMRIAEDLEKQLSQQHFNFLMEAFVESGNRDAFGSIVLTKFNDEIVDYIAKTIDLT